MYNILLLQEGNQCNCRVKEYLQLSDYNVEEEDLNQLRNLVKVVYNKDLVMIYCNDVTYYFSLCERIRSLTDVPIVVLTGNDDEWVKIKMFQAGADDYIVEPYHSGELVARVRARLEQYRRLTSSYGYIKVGQLTIATMSRRVYLNNIEIPMTIREFDVLSYLAQRPDVVVSKEEIYQAMWQEKYMDTAYNSVAAYVKKIRKKIEPHPEDQKYIETIWGIGYRFNT